MTQAYDVAEQAVVGYKSKADGAAVHLLESFRPFIIKYADLISDGRVYLGNKSIRRFISLFMEDEVSRKNINKCFHAPSVVRSVTKTVSYIQNLFKIYSKEDIVQYGYLALYELADKYEPLDDDIPRFHSYLMKSFHYKLYHLLIGITQDPLYYCMNHKDGTLYESDEAHYDVINHDAIDKPYSGLLMTESDIVVDDNWVVGFTSEGLFDELNSFEKNILKLKYIDKLTDGEIADQLSICRATVNRNRLKIESKLEEIFTNKKLLVNTSS